MKHKGTITSILLFQMDLVPFNQQIFGGGFFWVCLFWHFVPKLCGRALSGGEIRTETKVDFILFHSRTFDLSNTGETNDNNCCIGIIADSEPWFVLLVPPVLFTL